MWWIIIIFVIIAIAAFATGLLSPTPKNIALVAGGTIALFLLGTFSKSFSKIGDWFSALIGRSNESDSPSTVSMNNCGCIVGVNSRVVKRTWYGMNVRHGTMPCSEALALTTGSNRYFLNGCSA